MKSHTPIFLLIFHLGFNTTNAQSLVKVTSVGSTYATTTDATTYSATGVVAASGTYTMKFGTNSGLWATHIQMLDYAGTASGACFQQIPSSTNQVVKLRRVDNAMITGNASCIWMEGSTLSATGGNCNNRLPYQDSMDVVFGSGWLNAGTDNLFNNTVSATNNNNIERFDVILIGGYTVSNKNQEGVILFERGANGAHDRVKIAGVAGLDGSNDPSSYKSGPLAIVTADWGDLTSSSITYTVLRRDAADTKLRPTNLSNTQNRGGIFIPFGWLGFNNGDVVYGYSLMGYDVTATTASQVLSYTNNTLFPLNTPDNSGGIDLIGVTYFYELIDICGPLPLELGTFTGKENGKGNLLNWTTLTEKNLEHFEIEYSADGNNFWKIGIVQAANNSSTEKNYTFYHNPAPDKTGYYRLKFVENNGRINFSEVIIIENKYAVQGNVSIFPNPAKENETIVISGMEPSEYALKIYSFQGELLMQGDIAIENKIMELNLGELKKGQYILELSNSENGISHREKIFIN
ncbi:MAG: T9SS type A sorting domain-containing protein [Fimbriimonadaceae bacterium]|nr:T9SS type A sorting domain-containing protein [Chitinophagales bacterium]